MKKSTGGAALKLPPMQRLMQSVVVDDRGCWLFCGWTNAEGYGRMQIDGRVYSTHRVAYEFCVGQIALWKQIDHLCRTHRCCNPEHLEQVDQTTNVLRGCGAPAVNARKTACSTCGGELTEHPTERRRRCVPCLRAYKREKARIYYRARAR